MHTDSPKSHQPPPSLKMNGPLLQKYLDCSLTRFTTLLREKRKGLNGSITLNNRRQGPRSGWGWGALAPPPPLLLVDKISISFYLSEPGLSFTKKDITLFYVSYRKRCFLKREMYNFKENKR